MATETGSVGVSDSDMQSPCCESPSRENLNFSQTNGTSKGKEFTVFKKSTTNRMITVYLGKRDFVDHVAYVDPIDGVVLFDRDYLKGRKVFGHVLATFRYGRDDLDVLGLNFRKELFLVTEQIYPDPYKQHKSETCPYHHSPDTFDCEDASSEQQLMSEQQLKKLNWHEPRRLTRLQEKLVKKLGDSAIPFFFELPPLSPASVTLQPGPGDTGKPCGVDYELKVYIAKGLEGKPSKGDSIRLAIRKIMYAPSNVGQQPFVEISKDFMMSPNKMNFEISLDKKLYHHGESIAVNVHIANNSNRTVKKIKVSVRQYADICLFSTAQYKCTVAKIENEEGCPVGPGSTLSKVYYLQPLLADNKDKRGLALDGQIKHEDTNLASSTLITDAIKKENLGIIVQYKVIVKLMLGPLDRDLTAELPLILMHQRQEGDDMMLPELNMIDTENLDFKSMRKYAKSAKESWFSSSFACKCLMPNTSISASQSFIDNNRNNNNNEGNLISTEPTLFD